jgi:hypothetical protein
VTLEEYLDPARFPLTTHPGFGLQEQLGFDGVTHADLKSLRESGHEFTAKQAAWWAGLEAKQEAREAVEREAWERDGP